MGEVVAAAVEDLRTLAVVVVVAAVEHHLTSVVEEEEVAVVVQYFRWQVVHRLLLVLFHFQPSMILKYAINNKEKSLFRTH